MGDEAVVISRQSASSGESGWDVVVGWVAGAVDGSESVGGWLLSAEGAAPEPITARREATSVVMRAVVQEVFRTEAPGREVGAIYQKDQSATRMTCR